MNNERPIERDRAGATVAKAMDALEVTIEALQHAVNELRSEKHDGEKTIMQDLRAMNNAFLLALKMEGSARELVEQTTRAAGGATLDLDAARDEIGIRLACLRAVDDNGDVSGGVE